MFVCVGGRGGETDERRELSWNGAICHIGMALELHGGPPHSRRVFRSQSWEQGGAWSSREGGQRSRPTQAQAACPLAGQTGLRREKEKEGEGGRRPRRGWSESLVLAKAPFSSACL